jgi:hypothetical protein
MVLTGRDGGRTVASTARMMLRRAIVPRIISSHFPALNSLSLSFSKVRTGTNSNGPASYFSVRVSATGGFAEEVDMMFGLSNAKLSECKTLFDFRYSI